MFNRNATRSAILPLEQHTIDTVERSARHQTDVVLQVILIHRCDRWGGWRKRGRGGGQPGPCQR